MDAIAIIGAIVAATVAGWLSPGPNMVAVMSASLTNGRPHGIAVGIGITVGNLFWLILALSGATLLFELFPTAVTMLKLVGASYLIWLGAKSLKSAASSKGDLKLSVVADTGLRASAKTGAIVALTNPKAALFFGSVFATFVPADASLVFLVVIAVICSLQSAVQHAVTAAVFSTKPAVRFFSEFQRWINGIFGLLFVGMGASVAVSTMRTQ
ncbi:LysE family translocator [Sulfitobacter sp. R86518]|uniref:LysE family translocator n=1 Tax=Sulfitobacter sp. R86518 TaxID=3093858 RepID=UPI0036DD47BB